MVDEKEWRPDNWDEIKQIKDSDLNDVNYVGLVFEAGADSIVRALKQEGIHINTGEMALNCESQLLVPPQSSGFVVFISDKGV